MRHDAAVFEPGDTPFGLKLSQKVSRDRCRLALASCGPRKGGLSQSDPDRMVGRLERRSALFKQFKLADHSPLDDSTSRSVSTWGGRAPTSRDSTELMSANLRHKRRASASSRRCWPSKRLPPAAGASANSTG